jgi:hypothetical protein
MNYDCAFNFKASNNVQYAIKSSDAVNYLTNADDTEYQMFTVDKDGRVIKDFTVLVIKTDISPSCTLVQR